MGRTIVAIKPSSSSTGASSVTRYIAESKRDPEKELLQDKEPRPLFSAERDGLSFQQADEILAQGKGWLPEKEDVIHLNTDNPHAHLAIGRQGIDRSTYEPKHIDHLPRTLLPHNENTPEGGKEFKE